MTLFEWLVVIGLALIIIEQYRCAVAQKHNLLVLAKQIQKIIESLRVK